MIGAGFGFRQGATRDSLADALRRTGAEGTPVWLATAEDKADHPALVALAIELEIPIKAIPAEDLVSQPTETRSQASRAARDTGSVAEAAALAALGTGARLVACRAISDDRRATCALSWKETT